MDPITLDTYRQRLLSQRQEICNRIYGIEDVLHQLDTAQEVERTDRVQAGVPAEVLTQLDEQSRQEMEDIEAALARLEDGTYGRCETCEAAIPAARLDAFPRARRCIPCQEAFERRMS
jgi:RNA polymerase-binding protein DksA